MRQLPPRARYFVLGTILAGGIITAGIPFLPGGPPQFDFHFLIFLAAALLAQLVGVRFFMPGREGQAWSLISAVLVASIILFSPASNVVLVLITSTAYWIKRRNIPWYQNLWNIAQHEVAVVLAALAWEVVRPIGTSGVEAVHWYAAAVTTGGVFYILNNLQTSTVIALASGRSFRQVGVLSRGNFYRELVLTWMGIIVADMWFDNPWRTVLIIVPLIGLSQMLRSEVEDAERIRRAQVEAEGRAQQLASLNELARGLTSSLEFDQIFDVLYAQLEKTVSPEVLSVALFDGQTNQVEFHVKADEGMLPVVTRPANAPEMRGVLATRTPLVLDPIRNRETVHAMSPHGRLLGSACVTVVPMALAERTVGVILLGTAAPPAGPQLDLISTMASQAAVAVEKAQLFQRERRKSAQLSAITQVSKKIVTIHNVDILLHQTARLIEESFGFARIDIVLHSNGGPPPARADGAEADIPILYREQTIGVMRLWLRPGAALSADDLPMLQTLADEIAVAIENARLYEHLQQQMGMLEQTQLQLLQSAKLATIGELAAFVAHEINNPLTSVLGYASLILSELPPDDPKRADIEVIEKEALRARAIVRDLLGYARQTDSAMEQMRVNDALESVLPLIRKRAESANVTINAQLDPLVPAIMADINQLKQVFINILNNAIDAMPDGGQVEVATRAVNANGTGPLVEISFQDRGTGIEPQYLEKIFDPFFTTKDPGKGTGLGLSISERILERFGATISAESKPGHGSKFKITLPYLRGY